MTMQPVVARAVDNYIEIGVAVQCLLEALYNQPNLSLRYCNGVLSVYVDDVEKERIGVSHVVPEDSYIWSRALRVLVER